MDIFRQCFTCVKPSYVDYTYNEETEAAYSLSHPRTRYIHRPHERLETIDEDEYEYDEDTIALTKAYSTGPNIPQSK